MKRLTRTRKLFAFLRMHRHELFDDAFQEELESMYRDTGAGKDPVAPALLAARAEKAVLGMIATESAIFVTLDIVLSPSFVRRRRCDGTPDKIDKRSRYSRRDEIVLRFR